jgi:tetratricopeptide (TPR) repeat protein
VNGKCPIPQITNEERAAIELRLEKGAEGKERLTLLLRIAGEYRFSDPGKMLKCAEEAQELAVLLNEEELLAGAERLLGNACELRGDYARSLEHLGRALVLFEKAGVPKVEIISINNSIAKVHANLGDYSKGLEFLYSSLKVLQELDNKTAEANTLNSMSVLYQRLGNSAKAEECAVRCLELVSESGNDQRIAGVARVNLGNTYGMTKAWKEAVGQWEDALKIFEAMNDAELQASVLGNLGIACMNLGEYGRSEEHLLRCLSLKQQSGNRYDEVRSMQNLSALYSRTGRFDEALEYCCKGLELSEKLEAKSLSFQLWKEMAMAFKGKGEFEQALSCFEKYHDLEKEIFTEEMRLKTDALQLRFACANNPLWLLRGETITEFEADKFPVGLHHGKLQYFRSQQVQLQEGDQLFLFTDGFADQFGGPKGKKLGYKQLRELLIANRSLSSEEQNSALRDEFTKWKGTMEQVDDVLLLGIKI